MYILHTLVRTVVDFIPRSLTINRQAERLKTIASDQTWAYELYSVNTLDFRNLCQ